MAKHITCPDGPEADHALTIKSEHPIEAHHLRIRSSLEIGESAKCPAI